MNLLELISIIIGVLTSSALLAWFIINLKLSSYFTKDELEAMKIQVIKEREEKYVSKEFCTGTHKLTDVIIHNIEIGVNQIMVELKEIKVALIRLDKNG